MPKQFLDFLGTGRSLLQMTYDRMSPLVDPSHVVIVTNRDYADLVRSQLPEIPESNILLEPKRRNTAPCICWSARHIYALDPEATIVTLPSDHLILKEECFRDAISEGYNFLRDNKALLTLGIKPHSPHTGYGYIQAVRDSSSTAAIMKVKSFTEKPDEAMAKVFMNSGEFYWNSGIFMWQAKTILDAFATLQPEIATLFDAGADLFGTDKEQEFIDREFPNAPSISVDYAIMEKASNVFVKTVDIGWSDLGSWKALYEVSPHNADDNVTQNCKILSHDCHGTLFAVRGDKIVVAAGLKDYIVADNGNALLICPIADEQRVRQVVNDVATHFGEKYV
jgi:mannose-1-phosphate guanylyltransferase